jgi:hypothetical protein
MDLPSIVYLLLRSTVCLCLCIYMLVLLNLPFSIFPFSTLLLSSLVETWLVCSETSTTISQTSSKSVTLLSQQHTTIFIHIRAIKSGSNFSFSTVLNWYHRVHVYKWADRETRKQQQRKEIFHDYNWQLL